MRLLFIILSGIIWFRNHVVSTSEVWTNSTVSVVTVATQQERSVRDYESHDDDDDDLDHLFEGLEIRRHLVDDLFVNETDEEAIKVFIGYKSKKTRKKLESMLSDPIDEEHDFSEIGAISCTLTKEELRNVEQMEGVKYIERNDKVVALAESIPYGIRVTQALGGIPPSGIGNCNRPGSFKVAIVDSGVYAGHQDLACDSPGSVHCIGQSFGTTLPWYADFVSHGTHIAGTINALGLNGLGVRGMVKDRRLCLIFARVFGSSGMADADSIMNAVRWSISKGAKVINMSLGGVTASATELNFYRNIWVQNKAIVVAASGNDGNSIKNYPASYPFVVSVSAVDQNLRRASFSQFNDDVDFAAPGVGIGSTTPPQQGFAEVTVSGYGVILYATLLSYSVPPGVGRTGNLFSCGLGSSTCPGQGGHVCVAKRGASTFEDIGLNCQRSGGVACIIYNYADEFFLGSLSAPSQVTIPVVGTTLSVGETLINGLLGRSGTVSYRGSYDVFDGTSMAAPHVTGAIAAIWRPCRTRCSHKAVILCLKLTARDLGVPGKDPLYGHGLIQTKPAYDCLKRRCCRTGKKKRRRGNRKRKRSNRERKNR